MGVQYIHIRVSSTGQGLYKVAELIGTMIQNRKDISIYINTQPGNGEDAGLFCLSCRGPGRQGGGGKESLTFVLNGMSEGGEKTEKHGMHTQMCSLAHTNQTWTHGRVSTCLTLIRNQTWDGRLQ